MKKLGKWLSRIVLVLLAVLAIAVITCVALIYFGPKISEQKQEPAAEVAKAEPRIVAASAKYLFAGTTFWGRRTNTMARASELGVKYPFSQLDSLNRDEYDAWIAGLECPLVEKGGVHNSAEEEKIFHSVSISLGDDIALDLHVHHDEVGTIKRVGHDATHKGRRQYNCVRLLLIEKLLDG